MAGPTALELPRPKNRENVSAIAEPGTDAYRRFHDSDENAEMLIILLWEDEIPVVCPAAPRLEGNTVAGVYHASLG